MRKVVDSNCLRSPRLRTYLAASRSNMAMLTDYAAMEAYKGTNTLLSIQNSMAILAAFPSQVVVLKNTLLACGLRGRGKGLQRRLIDEAQTREFAIYCRRLAAARAGDLSLQRQLLELGRAATDHLEGEMLVDAATLPKALEQLAAAYSAEEIAALRTGRHLPDTMMQKFIVHVIALAGELFRTHPRVQHPPSRRELPNTFIFRVALCIHLWAFAWIAVAGAKAAHGASLNKLRNDMVDINFAAYATYFDGLLSDDNKTCRIFEGARVLLASICDAAVALR